MDTKSNNILQSQIENLFLSLPHEVDFQNKKRELLKEWSKISFLYKKGLSSKFSTSPTLKFENVESLKEFLQREKTLALKFQEFENGALISNLLKDSTQTTSATFFRLDYDIEHLDKEIKVLFDTNSLIFKYEVIGARYNK